MAKPRKKATAARHEPPESTHSAQFEGGGQTPRTIEPEPGAGRYPRGYQRPDDRIGEEVRDRLTAHSYLDASDIDVRVDKQRVSLHGRVHDAGARALAEDIAESVAGVRAVRNELRIGPQRGARQRRAS